MKLDVELKNNHLYINGERIKKFIPNSISRQVIEYMMNRNFEFSSSKMFEDLFDLETDSLIFVTIHYINKKTLSLFGKKFILNTRSKGMYYPNPAFNKQKATTYKVKIPKHLQTEFLDKYGDHLV